MNDISILRMVVLFLGVVLIMCVGGVIWLTATEHGIPDTLTLTIGTVGGGLLGVLVPNKPPAP